MSPATQYTNLLPITLPNQKARVPPKNIPIKEYKIDYNKFKNELKEDNILKGKELLDAYCKTKSINMSQLMQQTYKEAIMKKYGFHDWDSVLAAIGHGGLKEGQIINRMQELYDRDNKKELTNEQVLAAIEENAASQALKMKAMTSLCCSDRCTTCMSKRMCIRRLMKLFA